MKRLVRAVLLRLGYQLRGVRYTPRQFLSPENIRSVEFDDIVCRRMFEKSRELTFIQIGACDGTTADPLFKYIAKCSWKGILVEPQASAVAKLRELYAHNSTVTIVQAAVAERPGKRKLFAVTGEGAPSWAIGLASFDREIIMKHASAFDGLANLLTEDEVECVTFESILRECSFDTLDILQIDTEGADAEVLAMFPFDRIRPAIVHWEVKHLSMRQREETLELLRTHGYRFAESGGEDMLAVAE